jgi:hypothetical protein
MVVTIRLRGDLPCRLVCAVNAVKWIRCTPTVLDGEPEYAARDPQDLVYGGRRIAPIA